MSGYSSAASRRVLFRCVTPFIIVSSGSMGNNGALTVTTALPWTPIRSYVYLPANAISAGSAAGWYYAVFSSTTAATVYNNVYDPASGIEPVVPTSPTAFATTGPGAYTQDVAAGHQGPTYIMPANTLGIYSRLTWEMSCRVPNNANVKSFVLRDGTTALPGATSVASSTGQNLDGYWQAAGSADRQIIGNNTSGGGSTNNQPGFILNFDQTAARTLNSFPIIATATDYMIMSQLIIWLEP